MASETREFVWLAQDTGVEHGHVAGVFADRDSAMRWLRMKHQDAQREAALADAYWRKDYAERAAEEADPGMRAHYEKLAAKPDVRRVSEITEGDTFAAFDDGEWNRIHVSQTEVKTFRPPTPSSLDREIL